MTVETEECVRIVIADTSVLINLMHTGHLPLLGNTLGHRFAIPDEVLAEILDFKQRSILEIAISEKIIDQAFITTTEELEAYANLTSVLGSGESACLALAVSRNWCVACDERRVFQREALARIGENRIINTPGLYLLWIRAGLLSVGEADDAKLTLEKRRFKMSFSSFRDLL